MFKIFALNYIWSGIPELIVYENETAFQLAWKEAWTDLSDDRHSDEPELHGTLKQSIDTGYMEGHKTEFRSEELFQSGVHISSLEAAKMLSYIDSLHSAARPLYRTGEGTLHIPNFFASLSQKIGEMILKDHPNVSNLWPRKCSQCQQGMLKGWVWGGGEGYACSERCLFVDGYNQAQLDEDYAADVIYYTEWLWDEELELNELIEMLQQQTSDELIQLDGETNE